MEESLFYYVRTKFFIGTISFVIVAFLFFILSSKGVYARSFASYLQNWQATSSLPQALEFSNSTYVSSNNYVYELGGTTSSLGMTNAVYYAPVQPNGSLGSWNSTTSLPQYSGFNSYGGCTVSYNGYIYYLPSYGNLYYASVNGDGTINNWTVSPIVLDLVSPTCDVYNNYIYILGGFNTSSSTSQSGAYFIQINSDGSLGILNPTTSLPTALSYATSQVYNGYIYVLGGTTTGYFGGNVNTVYYASINANGTLNQWNQSTGLPISVILGSSALVGNNLIEMGGLNSSSHAVSSVYISTINPNGTIGVWNDGTILPYDVIGATSVSTSGNIYLIGGQSYSLNSFLSSTFYTTVKPGSDGYTILGSNGNVYGFASNNYGDMSNVPNGVPSRQVVGFSQTPNDAGYYILTSDGGIYTFGNANFYGSVYNIPNAPVKTPVAIATTPDGNGYYVLTTDGGVYTFGDAVFHGSLFNIPSSAIPDRTPVAFGVTPDGGGYYIVTQNGSVYTFGDAQFYGSTYNIPNAPVKTTVAFAVTPSGNGYYLVTADGGVYTFGDAQFYGSMFNVTNPPVRTPVSFKLSVDSLGYYIVTADGGVYTFGDANYLGSIAGVTTPVAMQ